MLATCAARQSTCAWTSVVATADRWSRGRQRCPTLALDLHTGVQRREVVPCTAPLAGAHPQADAQAEERRLGRPGVADAEVLFVVPGSVVLAFIVVALVVKRGLLPPGALHRPEGVALALALVAVLLLACAPSRARSLSVLSRLFSREARAHAP